MWSAPRVDFDDLIQQSGVTGRSFGGRPQAPHVEAGLGDPGDPAQSFDGVPFGHHPLGNSLAGRVASSSFSS